MAAGWGRPGNRLKGHYTWNHIYLYINTVQRVVNKLFESETIVTNLAKDLYHI